MINMLAVTAQQSHSQGQKATRERWQQALADSGEINVVTYMFSSWD